MFIKNVSAIIIALLFYHSLSAQIDTEFWFVAPDVITIQQGHADRPIFLRVASSAATRVTVSQPANTGFTPIVVDIPADSIYSIDLTNFIDNIENRPTNQVLNRGLYITATQPVSVYYEVLALGSPQNNQEFPLNPEVFGLKGKNALGTSFVLPGQKYYYNSFGTTEAFDMVATQDNTTITITPSVELTGGIQANQTHTITLNRGQTYSLRTTSGNESFALRGTRITANKPIAVTWSDDSMHRDGSIDLIGDQLLPNEKLGKEYVVVRGLDGFEQDHVFVLAIENNTQISINGSVATTINAFATYEIKNISTEAIYITSTKPVSVLHLSGHQQGSNPKAIESGASIIPPLGCSGVTSLNIFKNTIDDFVMFVIAKKGIEGAFKINANSSLLTASDFFDVPGSSGVWVYARKSFSNTVLPAPKNHRIENSMGSFHFGVLSSYKNKSNLNVGSNYAFFSNYADLSLNLGADIAKCDSKPVVLDAGPGRSSYLWSTGATTRTISVTQSGKYWAKITESGCQAIDTIEVKMGEVLLDLGKDLEFCKGETRILDAGAGRQSYLWSTGATTRQITVSDSGLYWVEVKQNDCTARDSIKVKVNPLPRPKLGADTTLCLGDSLRLDAGIADDYLWHDGSRNRYYTTKTGGLIWVLATAKSCSGRDTILITTKNCDFEVVMPNAFSPNGDGVNDTWQPKGLSGKWSLHIFDRWGREVFFASDYNGAWDGGGLPAGTYYYRMLSHKDQTEYRGWIVMMR